MCEQRSAFQGDGPQWKWFSVEGIYFWAPGNAALWPQPLLQGVLGEGAGGSWESPSLSRGGWGGSSSASWKTGQALGRPCLPLSVCEGRLLRVFWLVFSHSCFMESALLDGATGRCPYHGLPSPVPKRAAAHSPRSHPPVRGGEQAF